MGVLKSIRRGLARIAGGKIREDILLDFDNDDEPDHRNYRSLGRRGFRTAQRDLRSSLQDEQNRQAFKLFIENAFIRRLSRMSAEFIVGSGITVTSKNEQVQEELDAWWNDPINDWERRHFTLAVEFPLYGEIFFERVVNQFTGRHRYNALDPLFVASVNPHPQYPTTPASVNFWSAQGGGQSIQGKILNGVPEETILASKQTETDDPMLFYFRTNSLSGSLRGHSSYYPLFEYADILDNASWTMAERQVILLTYVWHLKANNLDPETKKQFEQKLKGAGPGSALVSNMDVTLEAVTPDLKNADFTEGARYLRNLIAGMAGVPEHFMGEGGDVNRATATAMSLPTLRSFLQQQREYVSILRTLARANLVSVASKGRIPIEEVDNFTIQVDPMNPADTTAQAGALNTLVASLSNAKLEGWVSDDEARQAIRNVLGGIVELEEEGPSAEELSNTNLAPGVMDVMRRMADEMRAEEPTNGTAPSNGSISRF